MTHKHAFTLVEILVSIALIVALMTFSIPFYQSFQYQTELQSASDQIARALRSAQVFSQQVQTDSEWGVAINTGSITVFRGTNFATRDASYDVVYEIAGRIQISGLTEVYFSQIEGIPSNTGTITITINSDQKQITLNATGTLLFSS